jgi:hypothetical protein
MRFGCWVGSVPIRDPDKVDGGGGDDVLQMSLGQPDITASAQAAAADRLCMRAFDPGARSVVLPKFFRRLMSAGGLQRLKVLARLQPDKARLVFGAGAPGAELTWRATPPGETRLQTSCRFPVRYLAATRCSTCPLDLNPIEPPWYSTRMPGGVGGAAP